MSESIANGISLTSDCYECRVIALSVEYGHEAGKCFECEEMDEARLSFRAYQIVENGSDTYRYAPMYTPLMKISEEPSGHDWVASQTRGLWWDTNAIREEFTEPTVHLEDGGSLDNVSDIEDYLKSNRDTECIWCHMMTPKMYNDCQCCDQPLEANVR